jgi:hypothetical protein
MLKIFVLLATFSLLAWLIPASAAVAQPSQNEQAEVLPPAENVAVGITAQQEAGLDTSQEATAGEPQPMVMEETMMMEQPGGKTAVMMERTGEPLPESGDLAIRTLVLPIAALLLGSGILTYAFLWRR